MAIAIETCLPGGAVFARELRCASRRRRYYLLRFSYLCIHILAWTMIWLTTVHISSSGSIYMTSMMAQAARSVTVTLAWFQFLLSQLLMILLLSGAISDEIKRRTMGVLMTTPLSSFHIALGKLLSRFVHLLLLLALSLPVLATIRVAGGVPWDFILATWCVSLASAWATATLALFLSTWTTRMVEAAGRTFLILVLLTLSYPLLEALNTWQLKAWPAFSEIALRLNAFAIMGKLSQATFGTGRPAVPCPWVQHCIVMLGTGLVLLMASVLRIRNIGIHANRGRLSRQSKMKASSHKETRIYRVWEPILVWQALRLGLCRLLRVRVRIELLLGSLLLGGGYLVGFYEGIWTTPAFHVTFVLVYTFIGLLRIAIYSSMAVVEERERRTWPLLLTTELSSKAIVWQKTLGCVARTGPIWALLLSHLILFTLLRIIHPVAILILIPFLAVCIFLVGIYGLCISLWCQRSGTAIAITVTTFLMLSIPICCPFAGFFSSPLFSVGVIVAAVSGPAKASISWEEMLFQLISPNSPGMGLLSSQWVMIIKAGGYAIVGMVLALIAPHWVRHRIFTSGGG